MDLEGSNAAGHGIGIGAIGGDQIEVSLPLGIAIINTSGQECGGRILVLRKVTKQVRQLTSI